MNKGIWPGVVALCVVLVACDASTKPYLQHELSSKKLGDDCARRDEKFSMVSNTNGERYVLQECMNETFRKEDVMVKRKGDTVSIQFERQGTGQALYELTIDIDTYPQYAFLTIGNNTYHIRPA